MRGREKQAHSHTKFYMMSAAAMTVMPPTKPSSDNDLLDSVMVSGPWHYYL